MEDRTLTYVRIILSIPFLILAMFFIYNSTDKQQCLHQIDIDKKMDFHFVVSEKKKKQRSLTLYGKDLLTGEEVLESVEFYDHDRLVNVKDTIEKTKNQLYIKIKKKNKMYLVGLSCSTFLLDSVIYKR